MDHRWTKGKYAAYLNKEYSKCTLEQIHRKFSYLYDSVAGENALTRAWVGGRVGSYVADHDPEAFNNWYEKWVAQKKR